jgi:hypothetical protein
MFFSSALLPTLVMALALKSHLVAESSSRLLRWRWTALASGQ